jgi:dTDP-4-dehydrorhamnose reductase
MRVLVTGAGGQVGQEVVARFSDSGAGHEVVGVTHAELDVGDRDAVLQAITTLGPDSVLHVGAWTAVDACEDDPERAYRVNAFGTRNVQEAARLVGAHLVYVSTDYVFDGTKDGPYDEWDATNPQSVYGRSKLGGEREVDLGGAVVRTSWVCGYGGGNMVKTILRLAGEHDTLSFVDDQRGHPTFCDDLAAKLYELAVGRHSGTFHVTNQGEVSWFEFAQAVLAAAGDDPARVKPIATADLQPPRPAPRPANSVLDNAALRFTGLAPMPDFHEPLERLVKRLVG